MAPVEEAMAGVVLAEVGILVDLRVLIWNVPVG